MKLLARALLGKKADPEWRKQRAREWLMSELELPCDRVGCEYPLGDTCAWCGTRKGDPRPGWFLARGFGGSTETYVVLKDQYGKSSGYVDSVHVASKQPAPSWHDDTCYFIKLKAGRKPRSDYADDHR